MNNITKKFPGVVALNDVNFSAKLGEIHSIIGQNGAGKSTLMKILAGDYLPTQGETRINDKPVTINNQRDSRDLGISIVYQELSLLPNLSVSENIFLGREYIKKWTIDDKLIIKNSKEVLGRLGIDYIDVTKKLGELPLAQQQLVEISKALSYNPKILILDEPTAALTPNDAERLFQILLRLKEKDITILYITHRLKEILNICDRGTVLKNGFVVKTIDINENTSEDELIELMIGQEIDTFYRDNLKKKKDLPKEPILEVENLNDGERINEVSFQLKPGEILGLTGLLGAGQNEIARSLFGINPIISGVIKRNGKSVNVNSPKSAIKLGICLLTENRKDEGLFLDLSVKENISLPSLEKFSRMNFFSLINHRKEKKHVNKIIEKVNVILRSAETKIRTLSGGNQQKSILARWLLKDLDVLVFIEPTRGIDVGAKAEIYRYLEELANEGRGIIVVSPDLNEILGISDRVLVLHDGKIISEFLAEEASEEVLLSAIQGAIKPKKNK